MKTVDRMMRRSGWKKGKKLTSEEICACRVSLENATRESFEKFRRARQRSWMNAAHILLD